MSVPAHVSVITLGVGDLARSTAFYEALGWQRSSASQDVITFFELGSVVLGLFGADDLAVEAGVVAAAPGGFRGVALAINVGSRARVDAMFAEWVAAGARPLRAPTAAAWGGYSAYVADPDGHVWELAHNPVSPQWAAPGTD